MVWIEAHPAFMNALVTVLSIVGVGFLTYKTATFAWKKQKKDIYEQNCDCLHMVMRDFGNRYKLLEQVYNEIQSYETDLSSSKSPADVVRVLQEINFKISFLKPNGNYEHFEKNEMLFYRKEKLRFRTDIDRDIDNLEDLKIQLDSLMNKMENMAECLKIIRRELQNPNNFFESPGIKKNLADRLFFSLFRGEKTIDEMASELNKLKFVYSHCDNAQELKKQINNARTYFKESNKLLVDSNLITSNAKKEYFGIV